MLLNVLLFVASHNSVFRDFKTESASTPKHPHHPQRIMMIQTPCTPQQRVESLLSPPPLRLRKRSFQEEAVSDHDASSCRRSDAIPLTDMPGQTTPRKRHKLSSKSLPFFPQNLDGDDSPLLPKRIVSFDSDEEDTMQAMPVHQDLPRVFLRPRTRKC